MEFYKIENLEITIGKEGANEFSKVSYPLRYGVYSEIKTPGHIFHFNLKGEIKFITGRDEIWPDPSEWLKRSAGNDWIYYSTGGYSGVYDSFGEYYQPCLSYPSNSINVSDPFSSKAVKRAIDSWRRLHKKVAAIDTGSLPTGLKNFLDLVAQGSPSGLERRSRIFHDIIGDRVTVLPPDARHVDYEVIPVIVADGCMYKCDFCRVKSPREFKKRGKENIREQVRGLKEFYGRDIYNYNAIFLAQHDALFSGIALLEFAAKYGYKEFEFDRSNIRGAYLFLFGSVDSFLDADHALFDRLDGLPFFTYINMGLESADRATLDILGKAIDPDAVQEAFNKMIEINSRYENIEITANFVFGDGLPDGHIPSIIRMVEKGPDRPSSKGALYFSPLINGKRGDRRGIRREFYRIKARCRLPAFLYLIQRL